MGTNSQLFFMPNKSNGLSFLLYCFFRLQFGQRHTDGIELGTNLINLFLDYFQVVHRYNEYNC